MGSVNWKVVAALLLAVFVASTFINPPHHNNPSESASFSKEQSFLIGRLAASTAMIDEIHKRCSIQKPSQQQRVKELFEKNTAYQYSDFIADIERQSGKTFQQITSESLLTVPAEITCGDKRMADLDKIMQSAIEQDFSSFDRSFK